MAQLTPEESLVFRDATTKYIAHRHAHLAVVMGIDRLAAGYEQMGIEDAALSDLSPAESAAYLAERERRDRDTTVPEEGLDAFMTDLDEAEQAFDQRNGIAAPSGEYTGITLSRPGRLMLSRLLDEVGVVGSMTLFAIYDQTRGTVDLTKLRKGFRPAIRRPRTRTPEKPQPITASDFTAVRTIIARIVTANEVLRSQ